MKYFNIKRGFSLAEVLVTLGLLGAIAALTIPTLAYNYRGKVLEQQFRATYSDLKEIASRLTYEHGDIGTFAYNCVYRTSSTPNCGVVDSDGKRVYGNNGSKNWASEIMKNLPGGGPLDASADSGNGIAAKMKEIYRKGHGPQGPFTFFAKDNKTSLICDNGGIWSDSKGRIWTFNGENQFICVDINGVAAPNRINVDVFVFKPMSAKEMAIWVYEDPDWEKNLNNYTSQIVPCDLEKVRNNSNSVPQNTGYRKGSGSAVDYCPFFAPIENRAPDTTSSRGHELNSNSNYWSDYIDYK